MLRRIEIEKAENGYKVDVWKEEEESESEMYPIAKKFVAKSSKEVMQLIKEHLGSESESDD